MQKETIGFRKINGLCDVLRGGYWKTSRTAIRCVPLSRNAGTSYKRSCARAYRFCSRAPFVGSETRSVWFSGASGLFGCPPPRFFRKLRIVLPCFPPPSTACGRPNFKQMYFTTRTHVWQENSFHLPYEAAKARKNLQYRALYSTIPLWLL